MSTRPIRARLRRHLKPLLLSAVVAFGLMQLVPYGWRHPNPPVVSNAPWPTPSAERLARDACYDCHSNETDWPVYSYVAPMSWLVRRDVEQGRDEVNYSDWDRHESEADDSAEAIADGSMPPSRYTILHSEADLTDAEKQELIDAFEQLDD